jgi:hypothetical protein
VGQYYCKLELHFLAKEEISISMLALVVVELEEILAFPVEVLLVHPGKVEVI